MIILNSPSNPTGHIISRRALNQLVDMADSRGITILSDEVYRDFLVKSSPSVLQVSDRQHICVNSFSKTYGMTGFRLGYAVADKESIKKMAQLQGLCITCVPEFIQHAGTAALDCSEDLRRFVDIVKRRLKAVAALMTKLPLAYVQPHGGFYVFPRITREDMTGDEFSDLLLSEARVCVTPGEVFGGEYSKFFRMSLCQPEDVLTDAISAMEEVLS
jgi:aspartate aminotransferase